jgi:hypothetical protein
MPGGVITTGSHPALLWPGIKGIWGTTYTNFETQYTDLFDKETSDKAYEEYLQVSMFGLGAVKPQGQPIVYDTEQQGALTRLTNVTYALGYAVTVEEMMDDLYEKVSRRRAPANANSMRQTKEFIGANIYNRAFTSGYNGGDGQPLCSTAHPLVRGGVLANKPTVDVDLCEQALEDALINITGFTDDAGLTVQVQPYSIITARAEWFNAHRILRSVLQSGTGNNDTNVLRATNALPGGIVRNVYLSSPHAWFIRNKMVGGEGMIYQERMAVQFDQDNDFNTKNLLAAAMERYAFGWANWRAVYGVNGP